MIGQQQFLIDKSAAGRILRPGVRDAWLEILKAGRISLCEPTEFEMLFSARSVQDYQRTKAQLRDLFGWHPVPEDGWQQILGLQEELSRRGSHRSASGTDLLVAVTAKAHGLTVLHYDRDFDTIAGVTELQSRWLAEPGSID
ncbi:PIN domain nuclease [Streptomyces sp. NBC_00249]|uniref:PIN domain nuclease n=1 Tax=Streptomyces sp. NBC_00249 TaxID=2975690 RepID=UPI00225B7856|nr:PIN domain nuclease [Streptomyces sp. NBC_00249]MCX5198187.1 PIN domain nuclease [Streptomyces sp. NBC_00249]